MSQPVLEDFVKAALAAGASRAEARHVLHEAGWSTRQVDEALRGFAEIDFVVPVPRPRSSLSARDAFVYLVMFVALYTSAYHLGQLLFQFVNLAFSDPLEYADYLFQQIRWSTAALVVAYPVFFALSWHTLRAVARDPTRRSSAVRRWLIHLTLAGTAVVVIGDLIALVYGLLSGGLTIRFVLKVLIVGAIAASVFTYYAWLAKTDDAVLER